MIAIPIIETLHATIQVLRTLRELQPRFKFEDEGRIDRLFGVGYSVGIPCDIAIVILSPQRVTAVYYAV